MPARKSKNLTETFIQKGIKSPTKGRIEIFDSKQDGLCVRVRPSGKKSWCVYYRLAGKNRKYTIGAYPVYSIAQARQEALAIKQKVASGIDPVLDRKAEVRKAAQAMDEAATFSVDALAKLFIEKYVDRRLKPSTASDYKRHLNRYIVPAWKGRAIASITKRDCVDLLDKMEDRAPIQCNRMQATLSKFFNWLIDERAVIEFNPVTRMPKRGTENARSRVLTDEELKAVWNATCEVGWPFGAIEQLLLLTAKRRGEVSGMRWSEIDLAEMVWKIPGGKEGRTKNKVEDIVPLSSQAAELIRNLPTFEGEDLVFPSNRGGGKSTSGFGRAKKRVDVLSGVEGWTFHDLRRTVRSRFSSMSIRKEVADKVLNHVDRSVDGQHYDWHDYMDEKRNALQAWADRLDRIVAGEGDNVLEMRRG